MQDFLVHHPGVRPHVALLGLFDGYVTLPVLESISLDEAAPGRIRSARDDAWLKTLQEACQSGLLERIGEDAFYIPENLAQPLHAELHAQFRTEYDTLINAFITAYAALARKLNWQRGVDVQRALFRLRPEEGNLIYALHLARKHGRWPELTELLRAVEPLYRMAGRREEWKGLVAECGQALASVSGTADSAVLKRSLAAWEADFARQRHDADAEQDHLLRLMALWEGENEPEERAAVLRRLAQLAMERGQIEQAEQWLCSSLELCRGGANPVAESACLLGLARIARKRLELPRAGELAVRAMKIANDEATEASAWQELGEIAVIQNSLEEAERCFRSCHAIRARLGDETGEAEILDLLGELARERGDLEAAEGWFHRSSRQWARLGRTDREAKAAVELGELLTARRAFENARECFRHCLAIGLERKDDSIQASALFHLGEVACASGHYREATGFYRDSHELASRTKKKEHIAAAMAAMGRVAYIVGNYREAIEHFQDSLSLLSDGGVSVDMAGLIYNMGLAAERQDDMMVAKEYFDQSLEMGRVLGDVPTQKRSLIQLVTTCWRLRQLDEAEKHAAEALDSCERTEDRSGLAEVCYRRARVALERLQYRDAMTWYRKALEGFFELKDLAGQLKTLDRLMSLPAMEIRQLMEWYQVALATAEVSGDAQSQLEILQLLATLATEHELWSEAEKWRRRCLVLQKAIGPDEDMAFGLCLLGRTLERQGRISEAAAQYDEAMKMVGWRKVCDWLPVDVLLRRAEDGFARGDTPDAAVWFQQARYLANLTSNKRGLAAALRGLGKVAFEQGDLANAGSWFTQSLGLCLAPAMDCEEMLTTLELGRLAQESRQWWKAARSYRKALRYFEKTNQPEFLVEARLRMGGLAEARKHTSDAIAHYEAARVLLEKSGDAAKLLQVQAALQRLQKR
ncbi:MAG: tetratricopeptide repeat protein [Verrucomicrobiota bacterium]